MGHNNEVAVSRYKNKRETCMRLHVKTKRHNHHQRHE
jgi:hypothetical protein